MLSGKLVGTLSQILASLADILAEDLLLDGHQICIVEHLGPTTLIVHHLRAVLHGALPECVRVRLHTLDLNLLAVHIGILSTGRILSLNLLVLDLNDLIDDHLEEGGQLYPLRVLLLELVEEASQSFGPSLVHRCETCLDVDQGIFDLLYVFFGKNQRYYELPPILSLLHHFKVLDTGILDEKFEWL